MSLLLTVSLVLADEQRFVYDLALNNAPVGKREVVVTYNSKNGFERRVVAVHTTINAVGQTIEARSTGTSGATTGFTTAVDINGNREQIQAQELPQGGWRVITSTKKGSKEQQLTRSQARLSTVDLVDPGRTKLLRDVGAMGLIVAETGEVLEGTVSEGTEAQVVVGGETVFVTRYEVTGPAGVARFEVDDSGLLIHSEIKWLGGTVSAQLSAMPLRLADTTVTIEGFEPIAKEEGI